ncbi:hypothetical protein PAXRUDRAFT_34947 [Paxillus rubicundulus Ve08.2h10]|uniref:Uncharacterized protein n=1 Tax=Paxillus rubicundulus Ve08.2h10 TaxID=930991 RepID=A0A0D0DY47_9AGAM|nr:hypothetical protein PAXRUDRAFT_34947 [Paxillus rubicundulus Ve08.2h10]
MRRGLQTPLQLIEMNTLQTEHINRLKLQDALERGYCPHGHSSEANDLALLIYHLGGANLLYALNQRLHIPSLRTLCNKTCFVKLTPTISHITVNTIKENLQTIMLATRMNTGSTVTRCRGVSLMIDETAQEEAAVFMPKSNSVAGLCWTHSHGVNTSLNTYQAALNIVSTLKEGSVHLGKEVTDGFYPLLAAPTCKTEDVVDMEYIYNTVMDGWEQGGGGEYVDIWSFATDGDATRRKAGHKVFLQTKISITSPLYGLLANMPGLNLYTGNGYVMLNFNYKHIFKTQIYFRVLHTSAFMRRHVP